MMAIKQVQTGLLMRDVLGENYVSFELRGVEHEQDLIAEKFSFVATLVDVHTGTEKSVKGKGWGVLDVTFNALAEALLGEYPSLAHLQLNSFAQDGAEEVVMSSNDDDTDMTAHLAIDNNVGYTFRFTASSRSAIAARLQVTLLAVEYFINSELAFYRVRGFLEDAKLKDRPDLVDRYTVMLTQLVMNSLYSGKS